jgi:hypothetical protein
MQMDEVRVRAAESLTRCCGEREAWGSGKNSLLTHLLSLRFTQSLASIQDTVKNFAVIYVVDITEARLVDGAERGGAATSLQLSVACILTRARCCLRCFAGARLQHDVRALRPVQRHVLLQEQAHHG